MEKKIRTIYSEVEDTTFIMEDVFDGDFLQSTECVGWYCGEPNQEDTTQCADRNMKATFERPDKYVQQLKEFQKWFDKLPAIDPDDPEQGYIYDRSIVIEFLGKRAEFYFGATPYNAIHQLLKDEIEEQS